jgi:hypothetical protein
MISALIATDMTTIACLGWGSLIWNPGELLMFPPWEPDGPQVRVEFLRKSKNGRVTLVLEESAAPVRSLWVRMTTADLQTARESLRVREDIPRRNAVRDIGVWHRGEESPPLIPNLSEWGGRKNLNAVIYTNLRRKFDEDGRHAAVDEVVSYLNRCTGDVREKAEEYVRKAPTQVNTAYRRAIEVALGWTPLV